MNTIHKDDYCIFDPAINFPVGWQITSDWATDVVYSNVGVWLKCNGQEVNAVDYPDLVGTTIVSYTSPIEKTVIMDSNTKPEGYEASASSLYAGSIYGAISNGKTSGWIGKYPFTNDGSMTEWIQVKFPEKFACMKYEIKASSENHCTPRDFYFSGSNDGVNFTILDTRIDIPTPSPTTWLSYSIYNVQSFLYYRLSITKLGLTGYNYYPRVAGFKIYEGYSNILIINSIPLFNNQFTYVKAGDI